MSNCLILCFLSSSLKVIQKPINIIKQLINILFTCKIAHVKNNMLLCTVIKK